MLSQENLDDQWNVGQFCLKLLLVQTKKNLYICLSIYKVCYAFLKFIYQLAFVCLLVGCVCVCVQAFL